MLQINIQTNATKHKLSCNFLRKLINELIKHFKASAMSSEQILITKNSKNTILSTH